MREYKYGLRIKDSDTILKYKTISLSGNGETKEIYELTESGKECWLLSNVEDVKAALEETVSWYRSTYNKPVIKYSKYQLEIVQVNKQEIVEKYNEYADQEKLSEYHKQKVEMALRMKSIDDSKKALEAESKDVTEKSIPRSNDELASKISESVNMNLELDNVASEFHINSISEVNSEVEELKEVKSFLQTKEKEQPKIEPVKQLVKGITKIKVQCLKSIPKEWGSLDAASVANCFEKGKLYLGYTKNGKFYVINEDKVPEFICNDTENKKWEDNFFFRSHFDIVEYIK